jgi:hypothetical protein
VHSCSIIWVIRACPKQPISGYCINSLHRIPLAFYVVPVLYQLFIPLFGRLCASWPIIHAIQPPTLLPASNGRRTDGDKFAQLSRNWPTPQRIPARQARCCAIFVQACSNTRETKQHSKHKHKQSNRQARRSKHSLRPIDLHHDTNTNHSDHSDHSQLNPRRARADLLCCQCAIPRADRSFTHTSFPFHPTASP